MQTLSPLFNIARKPAQTPFLARTRKIFKLIGECRTEDEWHSHPPTSEMIAAFDLLIAELSTMN